jgi:NodT family efflux transporter outer membrane factor (OMF) lipoprotein
VSRRRLAILAALALDACAVGPKYSSPPPAMPDASGPIAFSTPEAATSEPLPPLWWRLFDDRVLDDLETRALTHNNDLKVAAANLAYAEALLTEAKVGRYPATDLYASPVYGASAGQSPKLTYAAGFTAAYQVDLFGKIRRAVEAQRANVGAAQAAEDATRVTLAGNVAAAYANICGYGRQIDVAQRSYGLVKETYDLTVLQRNAGALSDFDVARQGLLLQQSQAAIATLEGQRRAAQATLAAFLGAPISDLPREAAACREPPRVKRPLPVGDGAALLRRRPDLREAERLLAADTARIGLATAELYPNVALSASVSSAASSAGSLFSGGATSFGLGPITSSAPALISWTFPNTGLARAHIAESRAQAGADLAHFDETVIAALRDAEVALATYAAEIDHRAALARARDAADEANRLAKVQYKAGVASFLDQITAESAAVTADQALAAADQAISLDQVAVFQALGGGWEDAPPISPPSLSRVEGPRR